MDNLSAIKTNGPGALTSIRQKFGVTYFNNAPLPAIVKHDIW